jgi:hypothetical protein
MSRSCYLIAGLRETANVSAQPSWHGICCYYKNVQIKSLGNIGRLPNEM